MKKTKGKPNAILLKVRKPGLRDNFKIYCAKRKSTMTKELTDFMKDCVKRIR